MTLQITNAKHILATWPEEIYLGARMKVTTSTGHVAEYMLARIGERDAYWINTATGRSLVPWRILTSPNNAYAVRTAIMLNRLQHIDNFEEYTATYVELSDLTRAGAEDYMLSVTDQCRMAVDAMFNPSESLGLASDPRMTGMRKDEQDS